MTGSSAKLDYSDYVCFPDDGRRHEIIGGEYFVHAVPSTEHQAVSARLVTRLVVAIEDQGLGRVLSAPTDVELTEHDIVQPDIVVLTPEHASRIGPDKIHGPPDLVVEISSPSTRRHDSERKFGLYERTGVREYWVVDLELPRVERYISDGTRFTLVETAHDTLRSDLFPNVTICLGGPREPSLVERAYRAHVDAMSIPEKMRRTAEMLSFVRNAIARELRAEHPDVSDERLKWLVARRLYAKDPGALRLVEEMLRRVSG